MKFAVDEMRMRNFKVKGHCHGTDGKQNGDHRASTSFLHRYAKVAANYKLSIDRKMRTKIERCCLWQTGATEGTPVRCNSWWNGWRKRRGELERGGWVEGRGGERSRAGESAHRENWRGLDQWPGAATWQWVTQPPYLLHKNEYILLQFFIPQRLMSFCFSMSHLPRRSRRNRWSLWNESERDKLSRELREPLSSPFLTLSFSKL